MERPWYRSFNWVLAIVALAIAVFGDVLIHSANSRDPAAAGEWHRQLAYIVVGAVVMTLFATIDYHRWQRWALWLYVGNLALLGVVMRGGHSALGAQRWISLGPLGTFQPSEPAKLVLAIVVAAVLSRVAIVRGRDLVLAIVAVAVPALLILKQPDIGTALAVFAILSAELFFGVARAWQFAAYAAATGAIGAFVVGTKYVLKPFQRNRLLVFLHPNDDLQGIGWNLHQSKIAVGSGELFGKGLYRGTQTQLNFVPEHSRDFIFTVVGEELGYVGALALIAAYVAVLAGGVRAMMVARDRFGFLLAVGIVAMFAFHIVVNIGMTIGIMPITGIPLPFMSYGGSAVLTDFAAIGVLLNIDLQRDKLEF
ncbi:MAG: rod shape-determining protein RodA, partial [Candidatus Baltobacteraceae bacterium]